MTREETVKAARDTAGSNATGIRTLADLSAKKRFVFWRAAKRSSGTVAKVPFRGNGRPASVIDPQHWMTRAQADEACRQHRGNGIGVVLGPIDSEYGLGGVDLDSCRDPATGVIAQWAQEVVGRLGTIAEISPSRSGVKAYFIYRLSDLGPMTALLGGKQEGAWTEMRSRPHPAAIEVYLGGRYFTVTEDLLPGASNHLGLLVPDPLNWLVAYAEATFPTKRRGDHQREPCERTPDAATAALDTGAEASVGFMRVRPDWLAHIAASLTDADAQIAMGLASNAQKQQGGRYLAALPREQALRLPGRGARSQRSSATVTSSLKRLRRARLIALVQPPKRPHKRGAGDGRAARYDLVFLDRGIPDPLPTLPPNVPRASGMIRWHRADLRHAIRTLSPRGLRLLAFLLGTTDFARDGRFADNAPRPLSAHRLAALLRTTPRAVRAALSELVADERLERVSGPAGRAPGRYWLAALPSIVAKQSPVAVGQERRAGP